VSTQKIYDSLENHQAYYTPSKLTAKMLKELTHESLKGSSADYESRIFNALDYSDYTEKDIYDIIGYKLLN